MDVSFAWQIECFSECCPDILHFSRGTAILADRGISETDVGGSSCGRITTSLAGFVWTTAAITKAASALLRAMAMTGADVCEALSQA